MPSAQKNSQATVTGVGDACPEPLRESPFPSLMLAWTLARGQAAELPHRAPLGHHMPPSLVVPPPQCALKQPVCDHLPPTEPRTGPAAFGCHVVTNAKLQLAAGPTAGGGARDCQEAGMGCQAWAIQIPPGWSSGSSHSWSSLHTFRFPPTPAGLDVESQACAGTGPGVGSNSGNLFSLRGSRLWPGPQVSVSRCWQARTGFE